MNYKFISESKIFQNISEQEIEHIFKCLQIKQTKYNKQDIILHTGTPIDSMGFILSGSVIIEQTDIWGNQTIFDHIPSGQIFAETYACVPDELLMVNVVAAEETEILFLKTERILKTCSSSCKFHSRLIHNLLSVMAAKNLTLTRKMSHITSKTIRGRLLSYLSFQALKQKTYTFEIPFNRQQLADYLCVDRSAMSHELSKMQKEGLLSFDKNKFHLKEI